MSNKIKINLKQYYPELYNNDYFIEVDQEIVNVFIEFQRAEWNYNQKIKYHKSYYSLNSQPYLENESLNMNLSADKMINDLVTSNKGLYRRYSDDFIVIIPNITKEKFEIIFNSIKEILNQNGNPVLKDEKTRVYYYEEEKLKNINMDFLPKIANTKNELEYLGFCFTGDKIKIRDKTMSKFYYRMYKKIKTIALSHGKTKSGKNISGEKLYKLYSKYGKDDKKGNFITYNERCEKEFKDLDKYFISYKNRFIMKLKNRYNKEMQKYKDVMLMQT